MADTEQPEFGSEEVGDWTLTYRADIKMDEARMGDGLYYEFDGRALHVFAREVLVSLPVRVVERLLDREILRRAADIDNRSNL